MRRELVPLLFCFWTLTAVGVGVTVACIGKPFIFGAGAFTAAALLISLAVTSEYRRS